MQAVSRRTAQSSKPSEATSRSPKRHVRARLSPHPRPRSPAASPKYPPGVLICRHSGLSMDAGTKTLPCHERQASSPCPNRFGSTYCILSNHSYVPGSSSKIKHGKLRPVKLSIMSLQASRCLALGDKGRAHGDHNGS